MKLTDDIKKINLLESQTNSGPSADTCGYSTHWDEKIAYNKALNRILGYIKTTKNQQDLLFIQKNTKNRVVLNKIASLHGTADATRRLKGIESSYYSIERSKDIPEAKAKKLDSLFKILISIKTSGQTYNNLVFFLDKAIKKYRKMVSNE